jgi:hypothetical protein
MCLIALRCVKIYYRSEPACHHSRSACAVDMASRAATEDGRRLLEQCILFRELEAKERNALFARVHVRTYSAGQTISRARCSVR